MEELPVLAFLAVCYSSILTVMGAEKLCGE